MSDLTPSAEATEAAAVSGTRMPCPSARDRTVTLIATVPVAGDAGDAGHAGDAGDMPEVTVREVDVLDLAVLEAMVLQALGPRGDVMQLQRPGDGTIVVHLSALARTTLGAAFEDAGLVEGWMELLANGLAQEALEETGPDWLAEAELGVELAAAVRAEHVPLLVAATATGPLVVDARRSLAQILAETVTDPAMVYIV